MQIVKTLSEVYRDWGVFCSRITACGVDRALGSNSSRCANKPRLGTGVKDVKDGMSWDVMGCQRTAMSPGVLVFIGRAGGEAYRVGNFKYVVFWERRPPR